MTLWLSSRPKWKRMNRSDWPLYFAHRGRSAKAPENTMAAFRLAWESGIRGIELDVRLCASGELVVFHDATLTRITGKDGRVEEATLDDLKRLDAGSWYSDEHAGESIPTLLEVLSASPADAFFDIEIKPHERNEKKIARQIADLLTQLKMTDRCMVSSFNPRAVSAARVATRHTAFIYSSKLAAEKSLKFATARTLSRPRILKPQWRAAIELLQRGVSKTKKPVLPWTVNDPAVADQCLSLGAAGIISDDPLELMKAGT